jgi:hypothetical protein
VNCTATKLTPPSFGKIVIVGTNWKKKKKRKKKEENVPHGGDKNLGHHLLMSLHGNQPGGAFHD